MVCIYLSVQTGGKSLGGKSSEDSAEHNEVDFLVVSASCYKEFTSYLCSPLIPQHIQEEVWVLSCMQRSIRCGLAQRVQRRSFHTPLLRTSGTVNSSFLPLLNRYLLIHLTGVIMRDPVKVSASHLFDFDFETEMKLISRRGVEDTRLCPLWSVF